jgi:hypothetical protein
MKALAVQAASDHHDFLRKHSTVHSRVLRVLTPLVFLAAVVREYFGSFSNMAPMVRIGFVAMESVCSMTMKTDLLPPCSEENLSWGWQASLGISNLAPPLRLISAGILLVSG